MDEDELLRRALAILQTRLGGGAARPTITVAGVYKRYAKVKWNAHSFRMSRDKLRPTVRRLGRVPAMEVTPPTWAKHREARRSEVQTEGKSKGKPPAESTLRVELGVAKGMFEWGVEADLLPFNPLRRTRYDRQPTKRKTWVPEDAFQRLLAAPEPRGSEQRDALHAWMLIQADNGPRFSEAHAARRDRLQRLSDGRWILTIDRTKGGKAHTIGVTTRTVEALKRLPVVLGSPYYFTRPATGQLYGKRTFHGWFRDACESCGLDSIVVAGEIRVRPHDLRRKAATDAVLQGADIRDVQVMLGHATLKQTEDYVQTSQNVGAIRRIMQAMERVGPTRAGRLEAQSATHVSEKSKG